MEEVIKNDIKVYSNQVQVCRYRPLHSSVQRRANPQEQFSLIDSRPTIQMGASCQKYDVKLLTYGTLVSVDPNPAAYSGKHKLILSLPQCGGFLAEKWLGQAEPNLYEESITPSQRKVSVELHASCIDPGGNPF